MNAKFLPKLSHEEYIANPAISRSDLMNMVKSPRHFWWHKLSGKADPVDTKPMQLGTGLHALVIEADRFADWVAVVPDDVKRPTKAQINAKNPAEKTVELIQWWDDFNARNGDKIALRESEVADLREMADAILSDDRASHYLSGRGHTETTTMWIDEETGLHMKYRSDFTASNFKLGIDIKTTANAGKKRFRNSMVDYGYDIQAFMWFEAMRALGHDPQEFKFVCVEKEAPFCVGLYNADDDVLRSGEKRYREMLANVKRCMDTDEWPSYTPDFEDIGLPAWHMYEIDDMDEEIEV